MNNPVKNLHPAGFDITRWISKETIEGDMPPDLAPFFAASREVEHLIGRVPLLYEEVRDEYGEKYLCGILYPQAIPFLALKWSDDSEEPQLFDYIELFEILHRPRPNMLALALGMITSQYGDQRPGDERSGVLVEPIDHPDGNRLAVLLKLEKDGLLSRTSYIGAMLGWQSDQPAATSELADIGEMFAKMMGANLGGEPPYNPLGGLFR